MSGAVSTLLEVLSTVSNLVPIPVISTLVQLAIFVLEQRRPPDLETIKAQIGGLNAEATIATFLAAVQAQIIALSYQNNSTTIEVATNALGFAGVLLDVITAFLALLASTITQRHVQVVERQLNGIDGLPSESLGVVIAELVSLERSSEFVYPDILQHAISKCEARLKALQSGDGASTRQTHTEISISAIVASCQRIQSLAFIGDAAGTAMLFGILCFLAPVLSLAIASQPPTVWAVSVVACSSIIVLPLVNRVLGVFLKMRS